MNDNLIKILITAKDEASKVLDGVRDNAARTADASRQFATGLAIAGAAAATFVGAGAKIAGDLEASRAGFITLLGSAKAADDAIAMIKRDAANTPFELPGLIAANQLLTSVTKNAGQSENLLMNVGKALTAMGKGQPELDRIIVNLQQIGATGRATMMDVRQFAFAGIPIFEMLSQATGKTGQALEDFISGGGVTFEMLEGMFNSAGAAGGRFADAFANQAGGFNQIWANLQDTVTIAMADIVTKSGAFDMIKNAMSAVGDWINNNKDRIVAGIQTMFKWIGDNAPVIAGVILGALVPAFASLAVSVWATLAPLIPFMAAGAAIALVISKVVESMGGWGNVMKALSPVLTNVGNFLRGALATGIDVVKKAIEFLRPSFEALWNTITTNLLPTLQRLWNFLSPVLIPALQVIGMIIGGVVVGAIWLLVNTLNVLWTIGAAVTNALITSWQAVVNAVTWVANLIGTVLTGAFNILSAIATPIINAIVGVFTFAFNIITGYINILLAVWGYVFAVIRGIAIEVFNAVWSFASPIFNAIGSAIQAVGGFFGGVFNNIRNTAISVFSAIWGFISPIINNIRNAFGAAIDGVVGFFSGMWGRISGFISNIANGIRNGVSGVFDGITNGIKSALNWVIDKINDFIRGINNTAGKLPGVPQLGTLPRLYTGGQVTQGGWATVGENGKENVWLPAGAEVVSNRNTQSMLANAPGGKGGGDFNLTIEYNGRGQFTQDDAVDMAKQIRDALRAQGLDMTQIGALRG